MFGPSLIFYPMEEERAAEDSLGVVIHLVKLFEVKDISRLLATYSRRLEQMKECLCDEIVVSVLFKR